MSEQPPFRPEINDDEPLPDIHTILDGIEEAVNSHDARGVVDGLARLRAVTMRDYFEEENLPNPDLDKLSQLRQQIDQMDAVIAGYEGLVREGDSRQVLEEAAELHQIYRKGLS